MLTSLLAVAFAAGGSDLLVHTVGVQGVYTTSVPAGDVDLLVGERIRWRLSDRVQVLANARFLVDPYGPAKLERYRVRALGVRLDLGRVHLLLGRHPVIAGGPRLVDGVQVGLDIGKSQLGVWAGLAPDLFTTAPRLRPGFGPSWTYIDSTWQLGAMGEVLLAEGGLDRAGVLATGRFAPSRLFAVDGRLDLELASATGGPHLSDLQLAVSTRPVKALRLSLFYNAFSSLRYLRTETLDPELRRFDQRILEEGLADTFTQDQKDPAVNHMGGLNATFRPVGEGVRPLLELRARYRHNPDPANVFGRVSLRAGLAGSNGAEGGVVATFRWVDAAPQVDAGLQGSVPFLDGWCSLDSSALVLIAPERFTGPGGYADTFIDVTTAPGLVVGAGLNAVLEPLDDLELGLGGFLRLSYYQRRRASR